jgi:hypothetical protein
LTQLESNIVAGTTLTVTLREIARRLARLPDSRSGGIADGGLLSLLKSGDLSAGFYFPGREVLWVQIPTSYWATVSSDAFRSIRRADGDERHVGAYKVKITKFIDQYVQAMSQHLQRTGQDGEAKDWNASFLAEFGPALSAASRRFEVSILASEWERYTRDNSINEPGPAIKGKSGRPPNTGWRDLVVIVGAYLVKHYETTKEDIKVEHAAEMIHAIGQEDAVVGLPATSTIKDVLTDMKGKARKLSIK